MIIKNFNKIATSESRKKVLQIAEAGLEAIQTTRVIKNTVRLKEDKLYVKDKIFNLKDFKRIFLIAVGKCSVDAILALEKILGDRLSGGILIDIRTPPAFKKIVAFRGHHPMPTKENIEATQKIIALLKKLKKEDLVIFLISGGGSTLLCDPAKLSYSEEAKILKTLFETGATIQEINTVRKHISLARGGHLAKYAYPAKVISLIFSDIPGDDLSFVASGPTIKDTTTIADAKKILEKHQVLKRCHLKDCDLIETPKDKKYFQNTENISIVSNKVALEAMFKKAAVLKLKPKICSSCLVGEARKVGQNILSEIRNSPKNTALIYGGETTVTIKGNSKGGRNQELVLGALLDIKKGETVASLDSDGYDNSDFAGAICDIITRRKAEGAGINPQKHLERNSSYAFFKKIGDFILTGRTGSNVSDLIIAIKE